MELKLDAKPYHTNPNPGPMANEAIFKKESERLCQVEVLDK